MLMFLELKKANGDENVQFFLHLYVNYSKILAQFTV